MKKTIVVLLIVLFGFSGYFIGRLTAPVINTGFEYPQISYPVIYTKYSKVDSFDGYTGKQLDKVLKGTAMEGLGTDFSFYAWQNDVSSIYLVAHAAFESAWGTSYIARVKKNLFGFGAFDQSPFYSASKFSDYSACICYVSAYVKKEYLLNTGTYFNGYSLTGINTRYATDKNWADKVAKIMNYIRSRVGEPNTIMSESENWYIQFFGIHKGNVTKGQIARDLASLYHIRGTAGLWAERIGMFSGYRWWDNYATRTDITNAFRIAAEQYIIDYNFTLQRGEYMEKYDRYYMLALWKYNKYIKEERGW